MRNMFSIVIPLYNKGKLVQIAIDSALNQTYQGNWEIVVVDDGSKDDSALFVKAYDDARIKYFYKENGGVSSARNYGISRACGDWIVFLDADDELLPCALQTFEEIHHAYPDALFLVGGSVWISNGKVIKESNKKQKEFIRSSICPHFAMWMKRFYPAPRNMAIHRHLIEQFGGFDERMSYYEDTEFAIRLLRCGKVAYTNRAVANYIQDGSGLSALPRPMEKEYAYYIPKIVKKAGFWEKALLYEILELTILAWNSNSNPVSYYRQLQHDSFNLIYRLLHWIRQKLICKGIL